MVNVGDVFQFALEQRLFQQQVINTYALRVVSVPAGTTEAAYMAALFNDTTGYMNRVDGLRDETAQQQGSQLTHLQWLVHRVTPAPTNVMVWPITTNNTGHIAVTIETPNIAMSITRKGLLAGRRNKGRIAVAGIPQSAIMNGEFGVDAMAEAAGLAHQVQGVRTTALVGSFEMGWWNPGGTRIVGNVQVIYPPLFVAAVDAYAQKTCRVQRSRTIGVGS